MTSDPVATGQVDGSAAAPSRRRLNRRWLALIVAVIAIDVVAFVVAPPQDKENPGEPCAFPACFITSALEFPAPHTVIDLAPDSAPAADQLVTFHPSISNTLVTMWLVMVIVIVGLLAGGPVGRFKVEATRDGASFEAESKA